MSGLNVSSDAGVEMNANLLANGGVGLPVGAKTHYTIECFGKDGNLKWVEEFDNLVVTAGLNDLIDKTFKGSAYTAAWYVGLTDGTPTFAAGDVMSSHAGWTEVQEYGESVRQTLTLGSVAAGSANNSASKATFTIAATGANVVIGGAFVVSDDTKGGTTGTLYGGGAFAADRTLVDDDVLLVTVTPTVAAS